MPQDLAAIEADLRRRLAEIEALEAEAKAAAVPVTLDQQSVGRLSRMDAMQSQAMAQETLRRRALEVKRLHAALKRVAEDEYGWCAACGEEIAPKRLKLDPAAPLCADCAR